MTSSSAEKTHQKARNEMYEFYNPNPVRPEGGAGDCAVRAVAKALDISWEESYTLLSANGFLMGELPNSDLVWGSVVRQHGFTREIPNNCEDCYTVEEFMNDNPEGTFLVKSDGHVACVIDGTLYDSWDSSQNGVIYVWKKGEE